MPLKPDTLPAIADAREKEKALSTAILALCPNDIDEEHVPVVIGLGMGQTQGFMALQTGYSLPYIKELAQRYYDDINAVALRRNEVLAAYAKLAVYAMVDIGLQSVRSLRDTAKAGKLTAHEVAALSAAAKNFHQIAEAIEADTTGKGKPDPVLVRDCRAALEALK